MSKNKNKTFLYVLLVIVGLLLVAALTNPSLEKHKEAVKAKIAAIMPDAGSSENLAVLSNLFSGAIIDLLMDNMVMVDNYGVCSITKVKWEGEIYPVGIGIFGNVFITNRADELLQENLDNNYVN